MLSFEDASVKDIPIIQEIAERTWWPTYTPILSEQQLRYMLDRIYSHETLNAVMQDGSQKFILLKNDSTVEGFAAYGERKEDHRIFKLHKLYVLPENHGKGYGKLLIEEVKRRIGGNSTALDLNVNRYNPAKSFYQKLGFKIIREEDVPVGPYFMNDYVMRLELTPNT
jgi:diamine N-acetyltransferase